MSAQSRAGGEGAASSSQSVAEKLAERHVPGSTSPKLARLVSLDAYRGFIMVMLAASGFGVAALARLPESAPVWKEIDYARWQELAFHFEHPPWRSRFGWMGVSFWDLIQPAFMFMVGVALPYSYARRVRLGHSTRRIYAHAAWRALVLVLMGVFLQSQHTSTTNWSFVNVLSQIGLGYLFLYPLLHRRVTTQVAVLALLLVAYWGVFASYRPPADYDYAAVNATPDTVFDGRFASWSKNANIGHEFDVWFLNLFPQPNGKFQFNPGGYVTLNFVPSIGTMLLGLMAGQLLRRQRSALFKLAVLVAAGAVCMGLAIVADLYVCPIVKRIWTPSWVLFSGAYVLWMLAGFYLLFDVLPLRWAAFPLAIVGMNSIAMYLMGQLMRPWTVRQIHTHFVGYLETLAGKPIFSPEWLGPVLNPTSAFIVFWLIALWMYRNKFFVRV